jgi:hypothetical protein
VTSSYRQALLDTYDADPDDMQRQWVSYYPAYFRERWRSNVFFGFDLTEAETLVEAGAYDDAASHLKEVISFLETVDEPEQLQQAQALLEKARQGQEAASLLAQSRQALQSQAYEQSIELANSAEALYLELGNEHRLDEAENYRSWAQEVLAMRAELDALPAEDTERLVAVGQRLAELGDADSADTVRDRLAQHNQAQQQTVESRFQQALLLLAALVALRLLLAVLRRSPESRLL